MELRILFLLIVFVLFSACGQKGDLYLPEREPSAPTETDRDGDESREAGEEEGNGQ